VAVIEVRTYDAERDEEAILALHAHAQAEGPQQPGVPSAPPLDRARWRAFVALPHLRGGRDFLVATMRAAGDAQEPEARVVGLLTSAWLDDPRVPGGVRRARVLVDPDARRRGVGSRLVAAAIAQAEAEGSGAIETLIDAGAGAARHFAEAHGLQPFVHDLFLSRSLASPPAIVPPPPGITLRPVAPGDEESWAALSNATLVRDRVFTIETADSVRRHAAAPGFALWFACEQGTPIGFCHVEVRDEVGYVQALGVLRAWEGRGIGTALFTRGLAALRERGALRAELCTEQDNVRARRLYQRAGFALVRESFTLRRALPGALHGVTGGGA
jgi:mycothiol synthase